MSKNKTKLDASNVQAVPAVEVVNVTSVEMLDLVCKEEFECAFSFKGKDWRIKGRYLTPGEMDRVNLILQRALPDLLTPKPGDEPGDMRYDLRNPRYLEEKNRYTAQAQSLALYLAYPMFAQHAGVKTAVTPTVKIELLTDVMRGFFTSEIQQELWRSAIGLNRLWERVNFF